MRLGALLSDLEEGAVVPAALAELEIDVVTEDSRAAGPRALFVARSGTRVDGHRFVAEALQRGATAALVNRGAELPSDARLIAVRETSALLGPLCHRLAGDPSRRLDVVAVTGTNGKTSVVSFLGQLLTAAGRSPAVLGTLGYSCGAGLHPAVETTPGAPRLAELLAEAVANGCDSAALEASSHGLAQGRLRGTLVRVGIVTNVTRDHLDYHGTLEEYAQAKASLVGLIAPGGVLVVPASGGEGVALIRRRAEAAGVRVVVTTPVLGGHSLPGSHNADNVGAAVAAARVLGIDEPELAAAVASLRAAPGRLEPIEPLAGSSRLPRVVVDYAHNPDGLERALEALRPLTRGKLVVVFGCGGDRDRGKRPRMGEVAARLADELIVTSDNPRGEPPERIIDEILTGVGDASVPVLRIADRRAAIGRGIAGATAGDIVLIAGKGHETTQEVAGHRTPHDDRAVALEVLAALSATAGV